MVGIILVVALAVFVQQVLTLLKALRRRTTTAFHALVVKHQDKVLFLAILVCPVLQPSGYILLHPLGLFRIFQRPTRVAPRMIFAIIDTLSMAVRVIRRGQRISYLMACLALHTTSPSTQFRLSLFRDGE